MKVRRASSGATLAMALTLGLALDTVACARAAAPRPAATNEATLAVLGNVRTLHHEADVYESAGDLEHAAAAVQRVLDLDLPSGMAEADDVRTDAWGRLAELSLRQGSPDRAIAQVASGLSDSHRESVLRARLYMVRGQALGTLAQRAAAAGDAAAAAVRRAEALQALEQSIQINQRVLNRVTGGRRP